jgi:hypothetical protein
MPKLFKKVSLIIKCYQSEHQVVQKIPFILPTLIIKTEYLISVFWNNFFGIDNPNKDLLLTVFKSVKPIENLYLVLFSWQQNFQKILTISTN